MSKAIRIEIDLPKSWRGFRLPHALDRRLQDLLDKQDQTGKLTQQERREATALVELVDMLSLMKARADLDAVESHL